VKSYFETADRDCDAAKPRACYGLAEMYRKGDSIDADPVRAVDLHEEGCAQGDAESCFVAGTMNDDGVGIAVNDAHAVKLYEKACAGSYPYGCGKASIMYSTGEGVAKDLHKSAELASRACDLGLDAGCSLFAMRLSIGDGVKKDVKRAVELFISACDADDGTGCQGLARLYHVGEGVAKDEAHAVELMDQACELHIQQACGYPRGRSTGGVALKSLALGVATVSPGLDKAVIRRNVRRHAAAIEACYDTQLRAKPGLAGDVTAQFRISSAGKVESATASGLAVVDACVANVIQTIAFPKPQGGASVDVSYPISFHLPQTSTYHLKRQTP
jgi:TPR repeat protein